MPIWASRPMAAHRPPGRWGEGPSIDGKGTFATGKLQPSDQKPDLGMARPGSGAQAEQIG